MNNLEFSGHVIKITRSINWKPIDLGFVFMKLRDKREIEIRLPIKTLNKIYKENLIETGTSVNIIVKPDFSKKYYTYVKMGNRDGQQMTSVVLGRYFKAISDIYKLQLLKPKLEWIEDREEVMGFYTPYVSPRTYPYRMYPAEPARLGINSKYRDNPSKVVLTLSHFMIHHWEHVHSRPGKIEEQSKEFVEMSSKMKAPLNYKEMMILLRNEKPIPIKELQLKFKINKFKTMEEIK